MVIDQLIKEATLSKDKVALNAYKNLKTELQKVLTSKNAPEYSDNLFIQICQKYAKSLEDSINQFSEAHREDLISEYTSELDIVRKLLPEPVSASEIMEFIENDEEFFEQFWITDFIGEGEETVMRIEISKKMMGKAIKYLKEKFPTADGKMISDIVKKYTHEI